MPKWIEIFWKWYREAATLSGVWTWTQTILVWLPPGVAAVIGGALAFFSNLSPLGIGLAIFAFFFLSLALVYGIAMVVEKLKPFNLERLKDTDVSSSPSTANGMLQNVQEALRIKAFAYLDPPNRDAVIVKWDAPFAGDNISIALDYIPSDGHRRRMLLGSASLVEGQTVKTPILDLGENGWQWRDDKELLHSDTVVCRLRILKEETSAEWRFALTREGFDKEINIVGENDFCRSFD